MMGRPARHAPPDSEVVDVPARARPVAPDLVAGGEPGSEIQTPMAIVILFGLLSSTALNMLPVAGPLVALIGQLNTKPEAARAEVTFDADGKVDTVRQADGSGS